MIYFVLIIIALLFVYKGSFFKASPGRHNRKPTVSVEKTATLLFLILLWGLTAFRSLSVGNDTMAYAKAFEQISLYNDYLLVKNFNYMEIGYNLYTFGLSRIITGNMQAFLAVTATICYVGIGLYIYRNSSNYYISVVLAFVFCFSMFTNVLRESIAVVFCLAAYKKMKEGTKTSTIIAVTLIVFASLFHTTALVMLVLLFHNWIAKSFVGLNILNVLAIVLSITFATTSILIFLFPRYAVYFANGERVGNGRAALLVEIVFGYALLILAHKIYGNSKENRLQMTVFELYLLTFILSLNLSLISRMSLYFSSIFICEIPNMIGAAEGLTIGTKKRLITSICLVLLLWFIVVMLFRDSWNHIYPYEFWWS